MLSRTRFSFPSRAAKALEINFVSRESSPCGLAAAVQRPEISTLEQRIDCGPCRKIVKSGWLDQALCQSLEGT